MSVTAPPLAARPLTRAFGTTAADAGQVMVLGQPARSAGADVWAGVGHLVGTPFAYPELTVAENLTTAARLHCVPRRQMAEAVTATLAALSVLQGAMRSIFASTRCT